MSYYGTILIPSAIFCDYDPLAISTKLKGFQSLFALNRHIYYVSRNALGATISNGPQNCAKDDGMRPDGSPTTISLKPSYNLGSAELFEVSQGGQENPNLKGNAPCAVDGPAIAGKLGLL